VRNLSWPAQFDIKRLAALIRVAALGGAVHNRRFQIGALVAAPITTPQASLSVSGLSIVRDGLSMR